MDLCKGKFAGYSGPKLRCYGKFSQFELAYLLAETRVFWVNVTVEWRPLAISAFLNFHRGDVSPSSCNVPVGTVPNWGNVLCFGATQMIFIPGNMGRNINVAGKRTVPSTPNLVTCPYIWVQAVKGASLFNLRFGGRAPKSI